MSIRNPGLALAALLAAASLGACNSLSSVPGPTAAAALPAEPAAPVVADLPKGSGCGPTIAHTQSLVASDIATENLNAAVGKRFSADLDAAATACSAGRSADGLRLLAAAKARYGYR
ncbi:hypothetical protein [Methylobacterium haplocladii]|uniref:Lipoprotein n=1 Tax=Methylobacterium haplocladii TaxID=1176176 RepID=A0A512IUP7_9HYPH|nr:hypothetical protein [Methylobacterium haplocladii]GEP01423.1 hypothetical protein MHA02_38100 [Methylobacterium haplocladii]GJD84967.1 hypothetical protein HPGCJGGD_2851 [Methylobacterium haplocladii]GLS59634.1 hypothetical protein GCM10007887_23030 [Methylobacterium haplocladii]